MVSRREAREFERQVADIYRALGAHVEHDTALAGNQIDVLVRWTAEDGSPVTSAVECKTHARAVGLHFVNSFALVAKLLRSISEIDEAIIVSSSGFTPRAREAACAHGVQLLELGDLEQRLAGVEPLPPEAPDRYRAESTGQARRIVMVLSGRGGPFEELLVLSVSDIAQRHDWVLEIADYPGEDLPAVVQGRLSAAAIVAADVTFPAVCACYEIGYAQGAGLPTVLVRERGTSCRGFNAICAEISLNDDLPDALRALERLVREAMGRTGAAACAVPN